MVPIELCTGSEMRHVTFVEIPPFTPLPDVILWGARTFIRDPHESEQDPNQPVKYVEGFCFAVPPKGGVVI